MDYNEFVQYIKDNLLEVFLKQEHRNGESVDGQPAYEVEIHKVIKNNGIELDGVTLRRVGQGISPNIYLNNYYQSYQMGKSISVIMDEIIRNYRTVMENHELEMDDISDYHAVRDKIVVRLVSYEKNREQLKNCPYRSFLDLAVTFRYMAGMDAMGIASSLITNQEFECWGIGMDELYETALANTMRIFPWKLEPLSRILLEMMRKGKLEHGEEVFADLEHGLRLYVLTNEAGLNGATCMLYHDIIRQFSDRMDCDLYLLPSSIHEVMLVPADDFADPSFLSELVWDANRSAVGLIDLLSDSIYYYDREKDEILLYTE